MHDSIRLYMEDKYSHPSLDQNMNVIRLLDASNFSKIIRQ